MRRQVVVAGTIPFAVLAMVATLSLGQEPPPPPPPPPPGPAGAPTPGGAPGGGSTGGSASGAPTSGSEVEGTSNRGLALPGGAPEILNYKTKICFVIDRSGSMALADRFYKALDILDQLLTEMPKDTMFDVYLASETSKSLFGEGEWLKPAKDVKKNIRKRVADAGGLDYGGFTDIVSVLKIATERRRPNAVYFMSDGVQTVNELETDKIIASVAKVAVSVKVPIHTIAIGVGQDLAEDPAQALEVLRGISTATGGVFREVKSEARSNPLHRAYMLPPPWKPPPPEELVKIHLKSPDAKEIFSRLLAAKDDRSTDVYVEIEDPSMKYGNIPFEYSDPKLIVRTFMHNAKFFSETRAIPLKHAPNGYPSWLSQLGVRFVTVEYDKQTDEPEEGALRVRVPPGGSVEFVYKRGSREFRESAVVNVAPPRTRGG